MHVLLGTITRQRPEGLATLLESWARLERPGDARLSFAVVENDAAPGPARAVVERFRAQVAEDVLYALEPEPGIPFARNRVLALGRETDARYVLQCDDDQTVDPDWLVRLLGAARREGYHLSGGPNVIRAGADNAPGRFLAERAARAVARSTARHEGGAGGRLHVYTNNWCADLPWLDANGIAFDTGLAFTGSSDTALSNAVRAAGGRIGWVPDAIAREEFPARRCTYGYIFRRTRDQVENSLFLHPGGRRANLLARLPLRLVEAALVPVIGAAMGRNHLPRAVHKLGRAAGTFRYLTGQRSRHYAPEAARDHVEGGGAG